MLYTRAGSFVTPPFISTLPFIYSAPYSVFTSEYPHVADFSEFWSIDGWVTNVRWFGRTKYLQTAQVNMVGESIRTSHNARPRADQADMN